MLKFSLGIYFTICIAQISLGQLLLRESHTNLLLHVL